MNPGLDLEFECRPDLVVSTLDEAVYSIATEAKKKANVYQLVIEALAVALNNYTKLGLLVPISLVQVRGSELTSGSAYFPKDYLDFFLQGKIHPTATPDFKMFTKPRFVRRTDSPHNVIVGADLADRAERSEAIHLLAQAKALAVVMNSSR